MANSAPTDPLVLQNRLAVSLSRKRKLISSWLPPPTPAELAAAKSSEEVAAQEAEIWRARPATLGVGHPIPSSGSSPADAYSRETDLLRRRILGPNATKDARQRQVEKAQLRYPTSGENNSDSSSSEDEEEQISRATALKNAAKKRKTKREEPAIAEHSVADDRESGGNSPKADTDGDGSGDNGGFMSLSVNSVPHPRKTKKGKGRPRGAEQSSSPSSFQLLDGTSANDSDPQVTQGFKLNLSTNSPAPQSDATDKKRRKRKGKPPHNYDSN
ncbi:hypothetical protein DRE_06963 [Drechslerella stenobrocha 248]|uniref:Uncharacterized protein n=1 Tax=Drechslerella stenobrocha 248 TaxID=1043628 RepID=W7HWD2_9PEZI|nr:hypothetical protein DRE_06963 [Drechslerella stenobrocha 248]